jgi:hypothetical protein
LAIAEPGEMRRVREGIQTIDNPVSLVDVCQTKSDPSTKELFP